MTFNNRKMFVAALCALCTVGVKAADGEGLTFLLQSGQTLSFTFTERPKVIVTDDGLRVEANGEERISYAFDGVKRIYFEDDVISSVPEVAAEARQGAASCPKFSCQNGMLTAEGLTPGEDVAVYALSGQLAAKSTAGADGTLSVAIGTLPQGTYVVKALSGANFKIIKK